MLAEFDLSTTASGWHLLGINIDAAGNGLATYDSNQVSFGAAGTLGSFYVGYRENTQAGAVGVPSYVRPATFATVVPEPGAVLFGGIVCGVWARRLFGGGLSPSAGRSKTLSSTRRRTNLLSARFARAFFLAPSRGPLTPD